MQRCSKHVAYEGGAACSEHVAYEGGDAQNTLTIGAVMLGEPMEFNIIFLKKQEKSKESQN